MVITKLEGGLGNQMFQYAMGKVVAINNNDDLVIDHSYFLHLSGHPKITKYRYALHVFPKIKERAANIFDLKLLSPIVVPLLAYRWEKMYKQFRLGNYSIVHEKNGFTFDRSLFKYSGNMYLQGFWQHPKYLSLRERKLRTLFTFSRDIQDRAETYLKDIAIERRISVHVRRGDYLAIGLGVCSLQYYQKACRMIKKEIKDPYFIIVSNDIEWAQINLGFMRPALWVKPELGNEAVDLCIISQCAHHIIANSTFSWWGAWLNPSAKKLVIAPTPWLDFPDLINKTPVLANWVMIAK